MNSGMVNNGMISMVHLERTVAIVTSGTVAGMALFNAWLQQGNVSDLSQLLPEVAIAVIFAAFMYLIVKQLRGIIQDNQATIARLTDDHNKSIEKMLKDEREVRTANSMALAERMEHMTDNMDKMTASLTEHDKHAVKATKAVMALAREIGADTSE